MAEGQMQIPSWILDPGFIIAVFALLVSFASYRRTNTIKSLDLRLDLRRSVVDLRGDLVTLSELLNTAERSRKAVAVATGNLGSGRMKLFIDQIAADRKLALQLPNEIPTSGDNFRSLNAKSLEEQIVLTHQLRGKVSTLIEKYQGSLANDDQERKRIDESAARRIR
jgi:hypothetical protein